MKYSHIEINNSIWEKTIPDGKLETNEVHIWLASMESNKNQINNLMQNLSENERKKADAFYFEKDKNRYVVSHSKLRQVLSTYLNKEPFLIQFEYTEKGKPYLKNYPKYKFNFSHSGNAVIFAVSNGVELGIDIELIRNDLELFPISKRFFCSSEIDSLQILKNELRTDKFFQFWTRKEALVKACGFGLSYPIEHIDVSEFNGDDFEQIKLEGAKDKNQTWYIKDIIINRYYKAAIAMKHTDCTIHHKLYSN